MINNLYLRSFPFTLVSRNIIMNVIKGGFGSLSIHENEVFSKGTNLFDGITYETSMKKSSTVRIAPISQNQHGPYQFKIEQKASDFIDLSKTRLYVKAKVIQDDKTVNGKPIVGTDNITGCGLFLPSLFSSSTISINGKQISELNDDYLNYKNYLETMLSYGADARKTHLRCSQSTFDVVKEDKTMTDLMGAGSMEGYFPLNLDLFNGERLFPPGNDILLSLNRAKDNFLWIYTDAATEPANNYKIIIEDLQLDVKYIELNSKLEKSVLSRMQKEPVLLPITKTEIKTESFGQPRSSFELNSVYTGELPKTILVLMVETAALLGTTLKSRPYKFTRGNLKRAFIKYNTLELPAIPYEPDGTKESYIRIYRDLFDTLGISTDNVGNALTFDRFYDNSFMLAFNCNPDKCYHYHLHPKQTGTVNLKIEFSSPVTTELTVMTVASYDKVVALSDGRVTVENV